VKITNSNQIVIFVPKKISKILDWLFMKKAKKILFSIGLVLIFSPVILSQQITISGIVSDSKSGETLIAANIYDTKTFSGTVSNLYGFYSLKLSVGQHNIRISYTGYNAFEHEYYFSKDTVINVSLQPVIELQEVTVLGTVAQRKHAIESTEMGTFRLSSAIQNNIPALLGEVDIIKALQLLPGVQNGTEGSSGFYVRGGGPDQNLILLDGVPVYNVNHLFGFMSVFNPDAIRNVTLIKGGFPARYGGRLSSVLDIRMKEGNNKKFAGEGSIGIISSKLTLEGPIIKEKTSFMISGRRSYFDILMYPFQANSNKKSVNDTWVGYFLQDLNIKINHIANYKNRLYLSFYTGKDKFSLDEKYNYNKYSEPFSNKNEFGLQWGNLTGALRWNYIISNELFCNFSATVSDYKFKFFFDGQRVEDNRVTYYTLYEYFSHIRDYGAKFDFDYIPNIYHNIKFGGGVIRHSFSPGVTVFKEKEEYGKIIDNQIGDTDIQAFEFSVYAEDDYIITDKLKINAGFHFSVFNVQKIKYTSLEPRISGRYLITSDISLKASFVTMQQYLHLLANSMFGLPTDLWVPATKNVKPQEAWQTALGITYLLNSQYEFSLEGYYKKLKNIIDYAEGASFFNLQMGNWEDIIAEGKGECYGIEFLIQKPTGKLTGWIGYTLSWSDRYFENVSYGKKFPYRYDARHDLAITANYLIKKNIDCGMVWIYRTGYPFTFENERYVSLAGAFVHPNFYFNPAVIEHFDNRNNYRMPDYHRLDVGFNFHKTKKHYKRTWSFGMYNAYGRNNPFYVYPDFEHNSENSQLVENIRLKQVSIFNFIPYIRWSFKF